VLLITHRAVYSFTSQHNHPYPAAVPEVICTAKPETILLAEEVVAPLFAKPTVTVPEATAETYPVKYGEEVETVTSGATLNLEAGNTTANVVVALGARVAT
jgi:hypothetical protein